jgi:hypothetical protein
MENAKIFLTTKLSPPVKRVLRQLFDLMAVWWILKYSGDFQIHAGLKLDHLKFTKVRVIIVGKKSKQDNMPKYAKKSQKYSKNIPKIFQKNFKKISKKFQKKSKKKFKNIPKIFQTRLKILPVLTREHYTSLLHWV